jgi:hypothetical protein
MRAGDQEAAHILREIGLSHLRVRVPRSFHRWKQDVRDDYGHVEERTLYRVLAWLIKYGLVRRSDARVTDDDDSMNANCIAYMYYRREYDSEVPRIKRSVVCSVCGKPGVTKHSHGPGAEHASRAEWERLSREHWNRRARERRAERNAASEPIERPAQPRNGIGRFTWQQPWVADLKKRMGPTMQRRSSRPALHRRRAA